MYLKYVFGTKTNIFRDIVEMWVNFKSSINFKEDAEKIKEIADKVNAGKINRSTFVKNLTTKFAQESGLPADNASDQDKLDWFFTLRPELVISIISDFWGRVKSR